MSMMDRVSASLDGVRSNLIRVHLHTSDHAQYVAELAQVMSDLANDRPVSLDAGRWVIARSCQETGRGAIRVEVRDSLSDGDTVKRSIRYLAGN